MSTNLQYYGTLVYSTAKQQGVPDSVAKIIAEQGAHESQEFTSNVFVKNNNAFGMKVPSIRKSPYILGSGTNAPANEGSTPYARYASVQDSVKDLIHWLQYNKVNWSNVDTPEKYSAWIKSKGYYGDTQDHYTNALLRYQSRWNSMYAATMDTVKKYPKTSIVVALAGLTLIGFGSYYLLKRNR